jgi:hypothetical protein
VRGTQPRVAVLVPARREQRIEHLVRAHPDHPVNICHRHLVPGLDERLPPGHRVQVITVHQGAVHIEQRRCHRSAHARALPGCRRAIPAGGPGRSEAPGISPRPPAAGRLSPGQAGRAGGDDVAVCGGTVALRQDTEGLPVGRQVAGADRLGRSMVSSVRCGGPLYRTSSSWGAVVVGERTENCGHQRLPTGNP